MRSAEHSLKADSPFEVWLVMKNRYNHDWLKNIFMVFLHAKEPSLREGKDQHVLKRLDAWFEYRDDLDEVISFMEDGLSPRQLVEEPPLNKLPAACRKLLANAVHEEFIERTSLINLQLTLRTLAGQADEAIARLATGDGEAMDSVLDVCSKLSIALSNLPSRICA